ncbi:MAG: Glycosyl transferase family 41/Glycosyl transferases group 1 [Phormidium sp. OSCR]|nr:MAG: Glycosyl transferase family 41/Glycosyl transferases group 1 [Phormidium sp. OSCR]
MPYPTFNALLFYQPPGSVHRPTIISENEILCGASFKTEYRFNRLKQLEAPIGTYDIAPLLAQIPAAQYPELVVVRADATRLNFPTNLNLLKCPKLLIVGDTQHLETPIRTLTDYAVQEGFDFVMSDHKRQHLHFFKEAGCKNVFWLPGFNVYPHPQPPCPNPEYPVSFVGQIGPRHPYRYYILDEMTAWGIPLETFSGSQEKAAEVYAKSQINLNVSLNGDLNMRVFEVLSSGGFLLTDKLKPEAGLETLFEVGKHLDTYDSKADLYQKIQYYLNHPELTQQIAKEGCNLFWQQHQPEQKVQQLLDHLQGRFLPSFYHADADLRSQFVTSQNTGDRHQHIAFYEYIQEQHRQIPKLNLIIWGDCDPRWIADVVDLSRLEIYLISPDGKTTSPPPLIQDCQLGDRIEYLAPSDIAQHPQFRELSIDNLSHQTILVVDIQQFKTGQLIPLLKSVLAHTLVLTCPQGFPSPEELECLNQELFKYYFFQISFDPLAYRLNVITQFNPSFQSLLDIVSNYQKNPGDRQALYLVRQLRKAVTQQWLNIAYSELPDQIDGQLGDLHSALLDSPLRQDTLDEDDRRFFEKLKQLFSPKTPESRLSQAFLAATLYGYPHQFPVPYHDLPFPGWLNEFLLTYVLSTPRIFQDSGDTEAYHHHLENWLSYLHQNILNHPNSPSWQAVNEVFAERVNCTPLYFSQRSPLRLQKKRAELLEQILYQQRSPLSYKFPPRPPRTKIRLGVLANNYRDNPQTHYNLACIKDLDRNQFEIYLYSLQITKDAYENYCWNYADEVVPLGHLNLLQRVHTIRSDDLDILLIGSNLVTRSSPLTFLCSYRLARHQITNLSCLTTTGMRHIDGYIAGTLTANHPIDHSETLLTLEGSGLCFDLPQDKPELTIKIERSQWHLPENTTVFISAAHFRTLHPEVRQTWAKLLAETPNSILVLHPFGDDWRPHPELEMPFFRQMQQVLQQHQVALKRLLFVKSLPSSSDLHYLLQQADIYLDSFPHSQASSVLHPLQLSLPLVTLETKQRPLCQGAALLRELGLDDLVTQTPEAYRQLAQKLAENPNLRQQTQQQLQDKMATSPPFLNSQQFAQNLSHLYQNLL